MTASWSPSGGTWQWFGKVGDQSQPTVDGRLLGPVRVAPPVPVYGLLQGRRELIGSVSSLVAPGSGPVFAHGELESAWWAGLLYGRPLSVGLDLLPGDIQHAHPDAALMVSGTVRALVVHGPCTVSPAWLDTYIHLRNVPGAARALHEGEWPP